jgi:hypothetical protein
MAGISKTAQKWECPKTRPARGSGEYKVIISTALRDKAARLQSR